MARSTENPWQVTEGQFPHGGSPSERFRHLLNYAIVAPSSHNTQPWRFRLTSTHFGYADVVELVTDASQNAPLARVTFGETRSPIADEEMLFHAIFQRRSNRSPFEARLVPPQLVSALAAHASDKGVGFQEIQGEDLRRAVADLVAEGDRLQFSSKAFRRELARVGFVPTSVAGEMTSLDMPWLWAI